jgi:hypothetical protein
MWAVHDGGADSRETRRKIEERWKEARDTFHGFIDGKDERTTEDLCDAYALARFVELEIELRAGRVQLSDLHEKEIQTLNRCTKRYPDNLLAREWIQKA